MEMLIKSIWGKTAWSSSVLLEERRVRTQEVWLRVSKTLECSEVSVEKRQAQKWREVG